jgi:hypothetical protein
MKAYMAEATGLGKQKQACFCWLGMHTQCFHFRGLTGYTGNCGKKWTAHVQGLSGWHRESLATEAFNALETWK